MHPYNKLSDAHFWRRTVTGRHFSEIDYDPAPKFVFDITTEQFATAGSCFAQHFGRTLADRGGRLLISEARHPLVPESAGHGYGLFSARYGNIYTTRQLRELVQQAFGSAPPISEFVQRPDQRWIDALRPRAVPDGFSSKADAIADRTYHLKRVRAAMQTCTTFVFTLGLTEAWVNTKGNYSYGICPGVIAGKFDADIHKFHNLTYSECVSDLETAFAIISNMNKNIKILLTVSPVMLVATAESRGIIQSSIASKSLLRAAADHIVRTWQNVDYFPSYEIISGPQSRGVFYDEDGRDVLEAGVQLVMDTFFESRVVGSATVRQARTVGHLNYSDPGSLEHMRQFQADCDEALLDAVRK